jgi:hypothetical protein
MRSVYRMVRMVCYSDYQNEDVGYELDRLEW